MDNKTITLTNVIFSTLLITLMATSCSTKSNPGSSPPSGGSSSGSEGQSPAEPTATIPPPTPTTKRTSGKGKLHIDRTYSAGASNSGNLSHTANGLVPFTIQHNKEKGVYQVKGNHQGSGQTEFNSPNCHCAASWVVDQTVSGTLIPAGGLISEGSDGGCSLQIRVSEIWEMHDAVCNCDIGQAMVTTPPGQVEFGPFEFDMINGDQTGELENVGNTSWNYVWRVDDLDIPLETECIVGESIQ